ncbi:MAG: hypothetical protein NZ888_00795 [Candidatus Nitrosocaldus sp.]|nr:hypothetical protein [Candidatus Nitrosocaldus sp.]MDW7999477.1 hypothetical protein [Candidatus Nitrosocaldus sp.]
MSDDIDFMIVGVDGYYTDGVEQYYRIGDQLVVRGSVSGSGSDVSIRVIAPDGSIWYSQSVKLGYAKGLSYHATEDGVESREWSSENGFYLVAKRFSADDAEGMYRLVVDAGASSIERSIVFKRVEGSYSTIQQTQGSGAGIGVGVGGYALVGIVTVAALVLIVVMRRRIGGKSRRESKSEEVVGR